MRCFDRFHSNSQLLLSPPDSTTGSGGPSGHPSSTLHYSTTLPKPLTSNAGAADHYSSAPPSILSSNWPGPSMTSMDRSRLSVHYCVKTAPSGISLKTNRVIQSPSTFVTSPWLQHGKWYRRSTRQPTSGGQVESFLSLDWTTHKRRDIPTCTIQQIFTC